MLKYTLNEPRPEKKLFLPYMNNKGADQPAHMRSLISAFVVHYNGADQPVHPRSLISAFIVRCLDSIISLLAIAEISRP